MDAPHKDKENGHGALSVILFSFGFKHGVPVDANLLFDVRFLPNPYWQEELRPQSGMAEPVSDFVIESDSGREFLELLHPLIRVVAARSAADKKELRIGIGCTGGRHRSVAVVEALAKLLAQDPGIELVTRHRDIGRDGHST